MQVAQDSQTKTGGIFNNPSPTTLSQEIIPAVRGEYYGYSSIFTREQPLYALMKCKANKSRSLSAIADLGSEVNALFQFNESESKIFPIQTAKNLGLLDKVNPNVVFDDIWLTPTNLSAKQFMKLQADKNGEKLVNMCQKAINGHCTDVKLRKGLVVAMMTNKGKYGMFLVSKITPFSVKIEACHILL